MIEKRKDTIERAATAAKLTVGAVLGAVAVDYTLMKFGVDSPLPIPVKMEQGESRGHYAAGFLAAWAAFRHYRDAPLKVRMGMAVSAAAVADFGLEVGQELLQEFGVLPQSPNFLEDANIEDTVDDLYAALEGGAILVGIEESVRLLRKPLEPAGGEAYETALARD